jgi:3-deoxy-manno-octulosonate cytidylyltransferase (CMP-KDO synthetase)
MKIIGVIPARYKSSRFEGKPLADIHGKPMIWWVYMQSKKVSLFDEVYVATDDDRIEEACVKLNLSCIRTSEKHQTGTDRVAEVASLIDADIIVNIQGDEPMIEPQNIEKAILPLINDSKIMVTNLMTTIDNPLELINVTVPKVVTNIKNEAIYLSRSPIPYPKGEINSKYYKQVCVYGFRPEALKLFSNSKRGKLEKIEDIDLLRFIESNVIVQFIEVESNSVAVDTKLDLEVVKELLGKF